MNLVRYAGNEGRDAAFVADGATGVAEALASVGISRRQASRALGEGRVLVDGVPAGARGELAEGAVLTLRLGRTPPELPVLVRPGLGASGVHVPLGALEPGQTHLEARAASAQLAPGGLVLHCDPFLLAADKPAGLLVHGDGTGARTLTDEVADWLRAHGSDARPQALQRLDVDTTGIVLFSLAEEFQPAFDALVAGDAGQGRGLAKRYLAVAEGEVPGGLTLVDAPIGRDRHDARRMRVSATGKPARTHVRVLARRGHRSLLELRLETGRRHQIRVHLASRGYPLVGDALYGRREPSGLALHAWHSSLVHPVTGVPLDIRAPWPARFETLGFPAPGPGGLQGGRPDAQ